MARKVKITQPTENQEQIALMQWAAYHPLLKDLLIHVPNEGKRTQSEGAKLKRMGMRPGVSDIFLPLPTKSHHGAWIELKRVRGGVVTPAQQSWVDRMNNLGYAAKICYGFDDAKQFLLNYLDSLGSD